MKRRGQNLSAAEHLPPWSVRRVRRWGAIETPLTPLGLVDIRALIYDVKGTVSPDYTWPVSHTNMHHLYWPESEHVGGGLVKRSKQEEPIGRLFRELPVNKIRLPLSFHNWLHRVTVPPPQPDTEVMVGRIESWEATLRLFQSLHVCTQWEREARRRRELAGDDVNVGQSNSYYSLRPIPEARLREKIEENTEALEAAKEGLLRIPPEFQLVDPNKPWDRVAKEVGRLVAPGSGQLFIREASLPLVA